MLSKSLDYHLPESLVAQYPAEKRDESRLMVVERDSRKIHLDVYKNIHAYLRRGDCMVLNDTRVIRARLFGQKKSGGRVEVFLLHENASGAWTALVRPSAKVKPGTTVYFPEGLEAQINGYLPDGKREIQFNTIEIIEHLERTGHIPLPPYIKRSDNQAVDARRYQTVYAVHPGAVAAPTAGLHLTDEVFASLDAAGVQKTFLTLHVGYGTFKPIIATNLEDHRVDTEEFIFPETAANLLTATRRNGGRVVAVGTTCTRVLESRYIQETFVPGSGTTDIYIYPPYAFRAVDALQTNFHLPQSSLLALVCAFGGYDLIMEAYHKAVAEQFRFYSYGDCMLIL